MGASLVFEVDEGGPDSIPKPGIEESDVGEVIAPDALLCQNVVLQNGLKGVDRAGALLGKAGKHVAVKRARVDHAPWAPLHEQTDEDVSHRLVILAAFDRGASGPVAG